MPSPRLSVVLINYNDSATIGAQIGAILNQSFGDLELIVCDDGSTDDSVAVIRRHIEFEPRARLVQQPANAGIIAACERGRKEARGEFLYFASSDNLVLPGFFEKSVALLDANPQAGLCFGLMAWLHVPRENMATPMPFYITRKAGYLTPQQFAVVMKGEHITGDTAIYRADAYDAAQAPGGHAADLAWHQDWFTATVIACRTGCCHVPEPLCAVSIDPDSYCQQNSRDYEKQEPVVRTILWLLRSSFRDVMPLFAAGGLLSGINHVGRVVLSHPDLWEPEVFALCQKPLWDWSLAQQQGHDSRWNRQEQKQ